MHRTTLVLDQPLLLEIKEIARKEKKTLKKVICELLNTGLQTKKRKAYPLPKQPVWNSRVMEPLIKYDDKDELYNILDEK
jgi:hypothetical protein